MAKGKPTARSQNYLRQYGYPSERVLRREAQGLAGASVPTVRSVSRPYERQLQSSRDFLAAVQSALRDTSSQVGTGYDTAIAQSQGVDQAAQQRLAGLGLAPEAAVAQAGGDNATQNLIANSASAKNYAAQLPGIAAGQAYVGQQGINKNLTDALANRRDQLSQSFFQALQTVQGQALQQASFNQSAQAQQQNLALQYAQMGQQASEFAQSQAASKASAAAAAHQQGFSNKLARAQFRAQYGYDPITGKASATASGSPLAGYSPSELADIARASQPILSPSHTVNYSSSAGGKSLSQKQTVYDMPQSFHGQGYSTTVEQLISAGVPENVAVWQAGQMYSQFLDPHTAFGLAATIRRQNSQSVPSFHSFLSSNLWQSMFQAGVSYLDANPIHLHHPGTVFSGNPRG